MVLNSIGAAGDARHHDPGAFDHEIFSTTHTMQRFAPREVRPCVDLGSCAEHGLGVIRGRFRKRQVAVRHD